MDAAAVHGATWRLFGKIPCRYDSFASKSAKIHLSILLLIGLPFSDSHMNYFKCTITVIGEKNKTQWQNKYEKDQKGVDKLI